MTALISPRITVPCQILTRFPKNTSPTIVAVGATNISPTDIGLRLYNPKHVLAFVYFYEYFPNGCSFTVEKRHFKTPLFTKFAIIYKKILFI